MKSTYDLDLFRHGYRIRKTSIHQIGKTHSKMIYKWQI